MTCISSPYEPPANPNLEVITDGQSIENSSKNILNYLFQKLNLNDE
jgi:adenylylsulfate kinase